MHRVHVIHVVTVLCVRVRSCVHASMCECMYACLHASVSVRVRACTRTRMYACKGACFGNYVCVVRGCMSAPRRAGVHTYLDPIDPGIVVYVSRLGCLSTYWRLAPSDQQWAPSMSTAA